MTAARRAAGAAEPVVAPGSLNAMGLIDEVLHAVVAVYREHEDPEAVDDALDHLDESLGRRAPSTRSSCASRPTSRPAPSTAARCRPRPTWPARPTARPTARSRSRSWRRAGWRTPIPPSARTAELFDDRDLAASTAYRAVIEELGRFFAGRTPFGPDRQDLVTMLRAPALAEPTSLAGQLRWIRAHWGAFLAAYLGDRFGALLERLVTGLDVVTEEERARWMRHHAGPGGGGAGEAPSYGGPRRGARALLRGQRLDAARRAHGQEHVRLARPALPQTYGREIRRLDQIPDEELDRLARWGFTGLWLIGLWERSRGQPADQADARQPRRGRLRLLAAATTRSPTTSAARPPGRTCASGPGRAASASPPTWSRTTWASTRAGSSSTRTGSSRARTARIPATPSAGPTSPTTRGSAIQIEDHYWDSTDAAVVFRREDRCDRARSASSTTATTARACRGTTRPSSTT